jgi:hypothetical protein
MASDIPATMRDSRNLRDRIYQPTLRPLALQVLPKRAFIHVRDQGSTNSCTGFGLAAVIDYLLAERSHASKEKVTPVSARMLYEMALRHDQWPGHDDVGSSARGAMKGWHKADVCSEASWKFDAKNRGHLTEARQAEALQVPLGAYYRVLKSRVDVHTALYEVPALLATAATHRGWDAPKNGVIAFNKPKSGTKRKASEKNRGVSGHAFAVVGYTDQGLIVQN